MKARTLRKYIDISLKSWMTKMMFKWQQLCTSFIVLLVMYQKILSSIQRYITLEITTKVTQFKQNQRLRQFIQQNKKAALNDNNLYRKMHD